MSRRSITAATLTGFLLAACNGGLSLTGRGDSLSYAQYRGLLEGTSAEAILRDFGRPADVLKQGDVVRGLTFRCEDPTGERGLLRMVFDRRGRLQKWVLGNEKSR